MIIFISSLIAALILTIIGAPYIAPIVEACISGAGLTIELFNSLPQFSEIPTWWLSGTFSGHLIGIGATYIICLLLGLLYFASQQSQQRAEDGGILGDVAIKKGQAVIKGSDTWNGKGEPSSIGYVYGYDKGKYLYEASSPHSITVGSTGSGKSRYEIIPTIDVCSAGLNGANLVISDVKGELVQLTGDGLETRGYKVYILDTQKPSQGHRYNPLKLVTDYAKAGRVQDAQQAAEDIGIAFNPEEQGSGMHWSSSSQVITTAVCLYVAYDEDCPDEQKTMATVCRIINEGTEGSGTDPAQPLKDLFRGLSYKHPARPYASQFLSASGNELSSILSTLKRNLRMFNSENMRWMTSGNDIDPINFLRSKSALYLHVREEGSPYNRIFAIFFEQLYKAIYTLAPDGELDRQLVICADEFGNLPEVKCLPSLLSLGRSYGVHWYGAVQNLAQLNKYGERDGRKKILANCGVKVALKLGEAEDRQYFTELVGKTTKHTLGTSRSQGVSSSTSMSYSEYADDVLHVWSWTTRSPERNGAIVVKQAENGCSASHAGVFEVPQADCTKTPAKEHFDLGTREHEHNKRLAYQAKLDARANKATSAIVDAWCPEFPESVEDKTSDDWGDI